MDQPIVARAIIEMLGGPKEYIEDTLKKYVERLESEGVKIKKKELSEATAQKDLFSCFGELTIEFKTVDGLIAFCFDSLPSSIEIIEPDVLTFKSFDFSNSLNDLQARLHDVEMQLKRVMGVNELLDRNGLELIRNFILYALKANPLNADQIGAIVGIQPQESKAFLDKMVEENRLSVKEGLYSVN